MTYEKEALVAFGARLRLLRKREGMSQVALAEESEVSQATISRVERGEYPTLSAGAVRQLATALTRPVEYLLQDTGLKPLERVPYQWRTRPVWKG